MYKVLIYEDIVPKVVTSIVTPVTPRLPIDSNLAAASSYVASAVASFDQPRDQRQSSPTPKEPKASREAPDSFRLSSSWVGCLLECCFRTALRIGMLPQACEGWTVIHEQAPLAFCCCLFCNIMSLVLNTWAFAIPVKYLRWGHHSLSFMYSTFHLTIILMLFRYGPAITKKKAYYFWTVPVILLQIILPIRVILGALEMVPFGNRLAFALHTAVRLWFWGMAAITGAWAPDNPEQPYRCVNLASTVTHVSNGVVLSQCRFQSHMQ